MSETSVGSAAGAAQSAPWIERTAAWIKRRERAGLLVGVGIQFAALVGLIVWRLVPLLTGQTILLRVVPVDPRDMFRGDYVILSYEFSRGLAGGIQGIRGVHGGPRPAGGSTIYVTLVPEADGRHWRADEFSLARPSSGTFLRGTLDGSGRIEFGIESYYLQEGTGREYEDALRHRQLSAEVAVSPDGQAALRRLHVE